MKIFILDDDITRIEAFKASIGGHHQITVAQWLRGPHGAYSLFRPQYDLLLLDHDLGGLNEDEDTGFEFCRWLGGAPQHHTSVVIHSWNLDGANSMRKLLEENGWHVYKLPFSEGLLRWLQKL